MENDTAGGQSLKAQNAWKLAGFVVANVVVFWSILALGRLDTASLAEALGAIDLKDAALGALVPAAVLVLNGLIGSEWKAILVFWRLRNALPGCRAFSELAHRDPRVDLEALNAQFSELPSDSREFPSTNS